MMIDTIKLYWKLDYKYFEEVDLSSFSKKTVVIEENNNNFGKTVYYKTIFNMIIELHPETIRFGNLVPPRLKIFGSIQKSLFNTNLENPVITSDAVHERLYNICKSVSILDYIDFYNYNVSRLDIGYNWSCDCDVRSLIPNIDSFSNMNTVRYGNETYLIKNTQRQFRIYDKVAECIVLDKLPKDTRHNILREEMALFHQRNIVKSFTEKSNIFNKEIQENIFENFKKKLNLPADPRKQLLSLEDIFLSKGFDNMLMYLGLERIKQIGYKRLSNLLVDLPRATKYRYLKKLKGVLNEN